MVYSLVCLYRLIRESWLADIHAMLIRPLSFIPWNRETRYRVASITLSKSGHTTLAQ
jgi:hypothetical protein